MLGIVGALRAEVDALIERLEDAHQERVGGVDVHRGTLRGLPVAVVCSGVGKVNAALASAAIVAAGATEVIFTGVAGGLLHGCAVGDIVIATDLVQHDVDVTPLGRPAGELLGEPLSWSASDRLRRELLESAQQVKGTSTSIHVGRIASGDQFVADAGRTAWIRQEFDAAAVEMEGAALAQACTHLGVDFAVIRVLSDAADSDAVIDFPTFLREAAKVGVQVIENLVSGRPREGAVSD